MDLAFVQLGLIADALGWHHDDGGAGWWIVMMLGMVIFWGAVIVGVVFLVRGAAAPRHRHETPIAVLRRRLAEGEITVEEFERRRVLLGDGEPRTDAGEKAQD